MKILLTGGSGDLGKVLACRLEKRGDVAVRFDLCAPTGSHGQYVSGSILDREKLREVMTDVDCIVHIAAWHGYHEFTKKKNVYDFWDVNVTGTFNVFQTALEANIKKIIFISSESVTNIKGVYGWTKVMSEQIAQRYADQHHLNVLTLRPRAFIPYWNQEVYQSFVEWAKWFWNGAVHIDDVAQAVMQGIDLLATKSLQQHLVLPIDGAYEYTAEDLASWDRAGVGTTFKKYYKKYYDLAIQHGLNPAAKPTQQDMSESKRWLGYVPHYSLKSLLEDLQRYGEKGPPVQLS